MRALVESLGKPRDVNKHSQSLAWSLDIKRYSPSILYIQVLEVLEFMSDASDIPVLLDADTGYGNFNNARRLVRKLEDRGIAGKNRSWVP